MNWWRLILVFVVVFVLSSVLSGLVLHFVAGFGFHPSHVAWLAYSSIFGIAFLVNLSFVPLPFAVSIMIAAAMQWNPLLVALYGSLGSEYRRTKQLPKPFST
jgi:hypothetical protein